MEQESVLDGYRILDLTEGGYLTAGMLLAQMGADVIKIEPPGGSPSRNRGPFYKDIPHPEKSLFWFAYNVNKRGITLDIEKADGREIFKRLTKTADIVLESFPPGYMDSIGLGYSVLCAARPDIILTSISAYGQEGPKAHYKASDLTTFASSMMMYSTGNEERPPTQLSLPQSEILGGCRAAGGSLTALFHREMTGEGQVVDVRTQLELAWFTIADRGIGHYYTEKLVVHREGSSRTGPTGLKTSVVHPCKDGFVTCMIGGGIGGGVAGTTTRLVKWMDEEGMAPDWLKKYDWRRDYDALKITQEEYDSLVEPIKKFFLTKSKAEFDDQAVKKDLMACAIYDIKDVAERPHLAAREFWVKLEHPELDDTLTYCRPYALLSEAPMRTTHRAPLIGEHNEDVYEKELILSREELLTLRQARVI